MGFDGFDEKGNAKGWSVACNANIPGFELASNTASMSKEWNKKTSLWLNRYVYIRTNGNLMAVYSLSAFWHGFYPGYYLFFLSVPLVTVCERIGRKKISPYFSDNAFNHMCSVFLTSLFTEYTVAPFVLLALDRSWDVWKSHYFFGHIACVVFYVIMSFVPSPPRDDKDIKKKKQ